MAESKGPGQDMTSGPLLKKILLFALPIMAMTCLQLLFNAADMVVVGHFSGKEALGAVGSTTALINLLIGAFLGLSAGTSVTVAQNYGTGNWEGVSKAAHTSVTVSALCGLVMMGIGVIFCGGMLRLMGTPEDIIDLATLYMRIYFLGVPANLVYNFASAVLRAIGDSKHPMNYLVISGAVNAALNLVFVIVFHRSVDGVALATILSQYLAMVLVLRCLHRCGGPAALYWRKLGIDKNKLRSILRIGLPAGTQRVLFSISNVMIQSAVNSFGSNFVAGKSAYASIESFADSIECAFYDAAITFTGQCMGAKKYDRIDRVAKICCLLTVGFSLVVCGAFILFGRQLLGFYTDDPEVVELGMVAMWVLMSTFVFCNVMNTLPGLTRGMGYSLLPMLCTLVGACAMRVVWLKTAFLWKPTMIMLLLCYPISWALTAAGQLGIFFYARKKIRSAQAGILASGDYSEEEIEN